MFVCILVFFVLFVVSLEPGYVYVPGGVVTNEKCITKVPSGSHVIRKETHYEIITPDGKVTEEPFCTDIKPNPSNSWQQWTTYQDTKDQQIDVFIGNMVVPALPGRQAMAEILYIFPGLQNVNWIPTSMIGGEKGPMPSPFDIIQPVLQYNYNKEGWMLANWYVGDDKVLTSDYIYDVKEGDIIFGNMSRVDEDTYIIYSDVNKGKSTNMKVSSGRLKVQNWAYTTVEKYGGVSCDCFPSSNLTFSDMHLYAGGAELTFDWQKTVRIQCMNELDVRSSELVVYDFKN